MLHEVLQHFIAERVSVFLPAENQVALSVAIKRRIRRVVARVFAKRRVCLPIGDVRDIVPIGLHADVGISLVKVNVVLAIDCVIERVTLRRDRRGETVGLKALKGFRRVVEKREALLDVRGKVGISRVACQ